LNREQQNSELR